jgi:hypothetical protein
VEDLGTPEQLLQRVGNYITGELIRIANRKHCLNAASPAAGTQLLSLNSTALRQMGRGLVGGGGGVVFVTVIRGGRMAANLTALTSSGTYLDEDAIVSTSSRSQDGLTYYFYELYEPTAKIGGHTYTSVTVKVRATVAVARRWEEQPASAPCSVVHAHSAARQVMSLRSCGRAFDAPRRATWRSFSSLPHLTSSGPSRRRG